MSSPDPRIFDGLNPAQREAVEILNGPLLILAGAGSGKTRVVTRRIANLIAHGVRPWEILAITFTNKAAAEMRHRVESLAGQSGVWLSTFHSFCARLLRREAEVLGYTRDFTIYDEEDASGVIKDLVKGLGLSEDKRYSPRNVRQMISNLKNQALNSEDLEESHFHERILKEIYQAYENELKKNQAFDFDDLLRQTVMLFRKHPEVLDRYRDRFKFVLVDEYQDTNACQYALVKLLGEKHRNICATGDPDQSIYAWRGADVRNILSFESDFPEAKVVKLEQNYRSTKLILEAASAVIDNNLERKKKTLWTENPRGEELTQAIASDEESEAFDIARKIDAHARAGRRFNDIAVFYRTNGQSRSIETALTHAAIPYQLIGGTAFYERREIKDALAYLRLIVNPKDDVSLRRVLNVPRRGLGDSALEMIEQQAAKNGCSLFDAIVGPGADDLLSGFKPRARQGLIQFIRLMDALRAMPPYPVAEILRNMLERSGLLAALIDEGESERVDNLNQLVNAAAVFDDDHDPEKNKVPDGPPPEPGAYDGMDEAAERQGSLTGFLENSALIAPTDNFNPEDDRVTLMTLHMAKGLEFPIVFISGMEEGLLPLVRGSEMESTENKESIEEERRLLYVGMTRAREKLYISRAKFRRRFGKADITFPSRFLKEIPLNLLDNEDNARSAFSDWSYEMTDEKKKIGDADDAFQAFEREVEQVFGDEQQPAIKKASSRRHDPALQTIVDKLLDVDVVPDADSSGFEIGDRVKHASFGVGTVESISGRGDSAKLKILFREHGPKLLLMSYLKGKLEKI